MALQTVCIGSPAYETISLYNINTHTYAFIFAYLFAYMCMYIIIASAKCCSMASSRADNINLIVRLLHAAQIGLTYLYVCLCNKYEWIL